MGLEDLLTVTMAFWFCISVVYAIFYLSCKAVDHLIRIAIIQDCEDRYILVTGCDTGFGNLLAKRLDLLPRCHVLAGCFTEKGEVELKKVASERLRVFQLDVTKDKSIQNALQYVKSQLPAGKGLWGVVNNAGVLSYCGPPEWIRLDDYKKQCDVNLWGLINVTLTFMPLVKKEKGRFVNIACIAGRFAFPYAIPYCISKAGVEMFTDGIRRNLLVFGCKAILIEPGVHKTFLMTDENIVDGFRRAYDNADPEVKAEYGEAYFNYVTSLKGVEKLRSKGSESLTDVVDACEHALLSIVPRARYIVGRDAIEDYDPLQHVPEWFADLVVLGMDPDLPLPAALACK